MDLNLNKKILGGTGWTSVSVVVERILGIITIAFLARLLEPKDFGLVAICTIVLGIISSFTDIGFESAIIQRKTEVSSAATTAFFITIALGICNYGLLFLLSKPIAYFYSNEAIENLMKVLSLTLVIGSFTRVHNFLLAKELQFRKKMVCEIVPSIIYSFVSVPLAYAGFGVWSIVYGELAKSITRNLFLILLTRWRPDMHFNFKIARELIGYGKHVMFNNVLNFASDNIDNAVVGKYLGLTNLSFYKMSYNAAAMPQQISYNILGRVAIPAFAKVQENQKVSTELYYRFLEYSSYIFVPAFLGLFIISSEFINLLYGPKWQAAIPLFQALIIFGLARTIRMFSDCFFLGTGKPEILLKVTFMRLLLLLMLLFFTLKFGLLVLCIGISALEVAVLLLQLILLKKHYHMSFFSHFNTLKYAFLFSIIMAMSVLFVTNLLSSFGIYSLSLLVSQVASGVLIYSGMILLFKRDIFLKIMNGGSI
jgi:O-antigen/teichoic acid export membrane protein